jgi:5-methylcytosine-specific restriction endonuclease McrA
MDTPNSTITKRCTKCGIEYPSTTEFFNLNSRSKDGLHVWCLSCRAAYRSANRERDRAKEREKYHADPEASREHNRNKYWANPEAARSRVRRSNAKHREKRRVYSNEHNAQYYAAHAQYLREYQREYRQEHPDRTAAYRVRNADAMRGYAHRRRARKLGAGGTYTTADIEAIRTAQGNRCYLCGKQLKTFHIDHFIPLALGGTNDAGNLRLACPACNLRKGAKHPHDMGRLI